MRALQSGTRTRALWLGTLGMVGLAGPAHASGSGPILEGWDVLAAVEYDQAPFSRTTTVDGQTGFGGMPIAVGLHAAAGGGLSTGLAEFGQWGARSSWTHTMADGHANAEPALAHIYEFRMEEDGCYSLDGFYRAIGETRLTIRVQFWNRDTNEMLFIHHIDGVSVDPSMVLGQGDSFSWYQNIQGSLSGTLDAGSRYRLDVQGFLRADAPFLGTALAVDGLGGVTLEICAIPAPGTLALCMIGLVSRASQRRRGR